MKLAMKAHYAVLFVLYLQQAERERATSTYEAAKALGLSLNYMEQIVRQLRIAGVLHSKRGYGGGYHLLHDPTIGEVLSAVQVGPFMEQVERKLYSGKGRPHAALVGMADLLSLVVNPVLREPISTLTSMLDTEQLEVA